MKSVALCVLLVAGVVRGHAGNRKHESCCPENQNNVTRRELREELEFDDWSAERWNNDPAGKRKQAEQCDCGDQSRDSLLDRAVTVIVVVFVAAFLSSVVARSLSRRRDARRMRFATLAELAALKSRVESRIEDAKISLVDLDSAALASLGESSCPVCLEAFDKINDRIVHPPNCAHVFHFHCLCQWLDTAVTEADKAAEPDPDNLRALTCPNCCRPLHRTNDLDLEAPPQSRDSLEDVDITVHDEDSPAAVPQ